MRTAQETRKTKETDVAVSLSLLWAIRSELLRGAKKKMRNC